MIAFIVKSGICMVLLFGLYWLLLRKEKLFIFNRYFLIFSVLLSMTVPFISFSPILVNNNVASEVLTILNKPLGLSPIRNEAAFPVQKSALAPNPDSVPSSAPSAVVKTSAMNGRRIFMLIYFSGFFLMLIRFFRNIIQVNQLLKKSEIIDNQWYKIALIDHQLSPFSFLQAVFMNKQDWLENRIAANVLKHELEHVRQSHSLDVIFFEILHMIFWFNPVIFLYKRAARINHEYLADQAVISNISDTRSYAAELINFISRPVMVPFTSGVSPSMIRLRLLMLNTDSSKRAKNIRMTITLFLSVILMSILTVRPAYSDPQSRKIKKDSAINKDIVIEEVHFKGDDFNPLTTLFIMNGKKLGSDETITVNLKQIKTVTILKDRKAIHKFGRSGRNGAVEITTYQFDKKSVPDSSSFKPIFTVNDKVQEETINIPVSSLYSVSIWTYPIFPNQDPEKRWRRVEIMTRDFYSIHGQVVRHNGEPLPGVEVNVTENPSKVLTDDKGSFRIADIRPDVMAQFSAEGYEPLKFKVTDKVFKSDLTVTLDKNNEAEAQKNFTAFNKNLKDFSGTWQVNEQRSNLPHGKAGKIKYSYKIHQYDSDSIIMNVTLAPENQKAYTGINRYVFNSLKSETDENEAIKSYLSCSINPDGQSFTVTTQLRSLIGLFREYKTTETFSLSADGKQMTIRSIYFSDASSGTKGGTEDLVFDKSE